MDIQEEIDKLEKERMEYLEADINKQASAVQKKIDKLRDKQELMELRNLKQMKYDLDKYKQFIKYKGLEAEFNRFAVKKWSWEK